MDRKEILEAINRERLNQDNQWGGSEHDDKHTNNDWIAYINKQTGKAVNYPFDFNNFKNRMYKVAALAVAAIEWVDRNKDILEFEPCLYCGGDKSFITGPKDNPTNCPCCLGEGKVHKGSLNWAHFVSQRSH